MLIKIEGYNFHLWTDCFDPHTLVTRGAVSLATLSITPIKHLQCKPLFTRLLHASVVNALTTCYLALVMEQKTNWTPTRTG